MIKSRTILILSSLLSVIPFAAANSTLDSHKQQLELSQGIIGNMLSENRNRLVIYPYDTNYLIYSYVNRMNKQSIQSYDWAKDARKDETKFQISIAIPILKNILGPDSLLGVSYTQRSFWQMLNTKWTSPFRDMNYEPQVFLGWDTHYPLLGFNIEELEVGFNHQSNGQPVERSRSWNRLYARLLAIRDRWLVELKTWYRIPEQEENDDNPDIEKYLGYYRLRLGYKAGDHIFAATGHYNWNTGYGNAELSWSYPLTANLRFYTQLFSGYGESMIDYNYKQTRIGLGLSLNDLPYNTAKEEALRKRVGATYTKNSGQQSDGGIIANIIGKDRRPLRFYAYEPNYIMYTYTSNINRQAISSYNWADHARKDETKFQISIGIPVWIDLFGKDSILAASYTQKSWWQSFNSAQSSPFRETNYEPQLFIAKMLNYSLGKNSDWMIRSVELGLNYQSNGRSNETARSWNRVYGQITAKNKHFLLELKSWFPFDKDHDFSKYLGYYRLKVGYQNKGHIFSASGQYNWNSGYGGVEVGYSYPVSKSVRFYTQIYQGYGESLIDYRHKQTRVGVGFMLNDIF